MPTGTPPIARAEGHPNGWPHAIGRAKREPRAAGREAPFGAAGGLAPPGNQSAEPATDPTGRVVRAAHHSCPP